MSPNQPNLALINGARKPPQWWCPTCSRYPSQFNPVSHPHFTPQPIQIQRHYPQRQWYPTLSQWLPRGVQHRPKPYQQRHMQVIAALAAKQPEAPREKWTCTICVRAMDKTKMREHVLGKRHEGVMAAKLKAARMGGRGEEVREDGGDPEGSDGALEADT
ncbi:hypothetical protein K440DRAFT_611944 [Wilcoxina mikolae CBS 423.85]|nr:hypothetical protein K440DRAFT_611944 [Wilcoxina mikolae CBS 423.85]